jgi:hypothetical protein
LRPSKMRVVRGCGCGGILGCGVVGAATQIRSQVMLWFPDKKFLKKRRATQVLVL